MADSGCIVRWWCQDKLWCEEIDCGEASGPRTICSGLRAFYATAEDVAGRTVFLASTVMALSLLLRHAHQPTFTLNYHFEHSSSCGPTPAPVPPCFSEDELT